MAFFRLLFLILFLLFDERWLHGVLRMMDGWWIGYGTVRYGMVRVFVGWNGGIWKFSVNAYQIVWRKGLRDRRCEDKGEIR